MNEPTTFSPSGTTFETSDPFGLTQPIPDMNSGNQQPFPTMDPTALQQFNGPNTPMSPPPPTLGANPAATNTPTNANANSTNNNTNGEPAQGRPPSTTKPNSNPPKPTRPSSSTTPLSCVLCRQRKVKCDKAETCSTCQRAGVKCVKLARQRLPRGRNGGRRKADTELKARIGKLENLVKNLGAGVKPPSKDDASANATEANPNDTQTDNRAQEGQSRPSAQSPRSSNAGSGVSQASGSGLNQYVGSSFWVSLSDEIAGIRDVLENSSEGESEEDEEDPGTPYSTSGSSSGNLKFLLFDRNSFVLDPNALHHPPRSQIQIFCHQYLRHADPMLKLMHGPTLRKYMVDGGSYLDYKPDHTALDCISFAIYYAAVTTMTDHDCVMRLGENKKALLEQYRFATETALAQADTMNTSDLLTLQALIIFIIALRHDDQSRLSWSFLAVAMRIAFAQGLHRESIGVTMRTYDREMRRRTWSQLLICDMQAAQDRNTEPMIPQVAFNTRQPLNIDDADISPDSDLPVTAREGFTEMTFALLIQVFRPVIHELNFVPCGHYEEPPTEIESNWELRRNMVINTRREVEERFFKHCDKSVPFQFFTCLVADSIYLSMLLMAVRPLQRHPLSKPPRVSGAHILGVAVQILEQGQRMEGETSIIPWRWYAGSWNKWHSLSVCLAELCVLTEGPDVERAWNIVDRAFRRTKSFVADTSKGMLWRPIEKLMKKAQSRRTQALQQRSMAAMQHQQTMQNGNTNSMSPDAMTTGLTNTPSTAMEQDFAPPVNPNFNVNFPPMLDGFQAGGMMPNPAQWSDFLLQQDDLAFGKPEMGRTPPIMDSGWAHWDNFVNDCYDDGNGNLMAVDLPGPGPDNGQHVQWSNSPF